MSEKKQFYRKLLSLVLPIAFQEFMMSVVSASDAIMLGFIDQDALSAVSLAGQIMFIYSLFLYAIMTGTTVLAAQYWGKKDRDAVEKILGISMKLSVLIAIVFTLAAFFVPSFLMRIFTDDVALINMGAEYLQVVAISYFLLGISQIYLTIMKNCGGAVKSTVISSVSMALNIVLNLLFIFGIGIFPAWGIAGAAFATSLSRLVELVWTLIIASKKDSIKIRMRYVWHNDRVLLKDFWKYTLPLFGNQMAWGGGFAMYSVIMGHMGSDAVAANSIANIIKNMIICFCCGIASGGSIIVGQELGSGKLEQAKINGKRLTIVAILSGVGAGLMILAVTPFVGLFSNLTPQAASYLKDMMYICSYYVLGKSINMTTIGGIFSAGGDSKFGLICDTITMWAVTVPIGLVAAFVLHLPVMTVYLLINTDEIIKLPAVFWHYKKYRWVKNITRVKYNKELEDVADAGTARE